MKKSNTTTVLSSPSLPSSFVPSHSKSASSTLYKLKNDKQANNDNIIVTGKRIQSPQSIQTTTTNNLSTIKPKHKMLLHEKKPRPLSDAYIGVKGLSKKFDSTNNEQSMSPRRIRRDSKPLLSPASQSVSRDRKISSSKRPASVNALSQLFASSSSSPSPSATTPLQSTKKSLSTPRQSKPLPPVHQLQEQEQLEHQQQVKGKK